MGAGIFFVGDRVKVGENGETGKVAGIGWWLTERIEGSSVEQVEGYLVRLDPNFRGYVKRDRPGAIEHGEQGCYISCVVVAGDVLEKIERGG